MNKDYTILVSVGGFVNNTFFALREGENCINKEVKISGDIDSKDLLSIASRLAISTYVEKLNQEKQDLEKGVMKENIANAFVVNPNGIDDYEVGIPMDNFENAVSITMPLSKEDKPTVEVLTKEQLKEFEVKRNEIFNEIPSFGRK